MTLVTPLSVRVLGRAGGTYPLLWFLVASSGAGPRDVPHLIHGAAAYADGWGAIWHGLAKPLSTYRSNPPSRLIGTRLSSV